jgi:NADH:ubiquinone oxidoreductase subunit 2 (subunit N)
MRVYPVIEKGILLIQLIVSKYVYILLMLRLEEIINPGWEKGMFKNTIMIIGIGGVLYGAYKGVKQKTYKGIIASSSILTLGIILISIRYGYKDQINEGRVGILINKYKELGEMPWEINHAIIIYILNILLLFGIYYGKKKNSLGLGIISLLSLIGVPPLAGFYSKVYLLTPIITKAVNNEGGQKGLVE